MMMMRKQIAASVLVAGLIVALGAEPARAVGISLVLPGGTEVEVGSSVSVGVVVSGLGDGVAPSVGAFDLDLSFDTGLLTYDDVAFGSGLGEPVTEALVSIEVVGGIASGQAVSLLSPSALDALQGEFLTLGSIFFTAASPGSGQLELASAQVSDAFGAPLTVDFLMGSPITVIIPESATALLVGLGLLGLGLRRRCGL